MLTSPPTYRLMSPAAAAAGAVVGAAAGALVGAAAGADVGAAAGADVGLAAAAAVGAAAGAVVGAGAVVLVLGEPHAANSAVVPMASEPRPAKMRNCRRLAKFMAEPLFFLNAPGLVVFKDA